MTYGFVLLSAPRASHSRMVCHSETKFFWVEILTRRSYVI